MSYKIVVANLHNLPKGSLIRDVGQYWYVSKWAQDEDGIIQVWLRDTKDNIYKKLRNRYVAIYSSKITITTHNVS